MSSKVLVNLPPDPFQQIKKKHSDILTVDRPLGLTSASDPVVRANQLEQNIRFLQEQHNLMLSGLHSEIETLRQRNRDLQFQIVFSKGVALVQNTPSPDDDSHRKFNLSPGQVNVTPLQVEILERDLAELRTNLSESKTRNVYLQGIIDEQKKKLSALENEKLDLAAVGKRIGKENVTKNKSGNEESIEELQDKLEDADRLIRRLRRENEEQRKEIVSLRTSSNKNKGDNRRNEGNNTHRTFYRNSQSQASRFPPLNNHSNWKNSMEHQSSQNSDRGGNRSSKDPEVVGRTVPSLPYLRDRNNSTTSTSTGYSNPAYNNYPSANNKRWFYYSKKKDDHRNNGRNSRREQNHQSENER